ncbi:MAG TPA: hypothetical protein VN708_20975 [Terriglobales bacterium]|nr:hypothetical protein [Terriglobales bacterium]
MTIKISGIFNSGVIQTGLDGSRREKLRSTERVEVNEPGCLEKLMREAQVSTTMNVYTKGKWIRNEKPN